MSTDRLDAYFSLSRQVYSPDAEALARFTGLLFQGIPLRDRSVLDVGGGSGVMSFFAAASGARPVICLEPSEAGSNPAMDESFMRYSAGLGEDVRLVRERFQDLSDADSKYDILLINSAINHLDEEACRRLPEDQEARARYREIFSQLADLTNLGGDLIIADAARKNAWGAAKLRSPFAPSIDWSVHAQPSTWVELAEAAGFTDPRVRWRSNNRLGAVGQKFFGNPVGAWLTNSMFVLHMRRG